MLYFGNTDDYHSYPLSKLIECLEELSQKEEEFDRLDNQLLQYKNQFQTILNQQKLLYAQHNHEKGLI